jgi:tRNA nucleotidyltransferase (CCA-adding enzyme)
MRADDPVSAGLAVYLVGGAVRDRLLGRESGDSDYVVVGSTPEAMLARGFRPVGRDFPVFLHPHTNAEYALARTERKSGRGYRGFVVQADPSVTLEDDLARRDLTINAMALDAAGNLVDPYGGARDIEQRFLRHVGPAFVEDPVRVLRLARFAARFAPLGFRVAPETFDLVRQIADSGELEHLVPERVCQELRRALAEARPSAFLAVLREGGALGHILPEVDALYGVPQRPEFHPEVDTGTHIELCLDMAARLAPGDEQIAFATLVHDLGKALTPKHELPRHLRHEQTGLAPIRTLCHRLGLPNAHRDLAVICCREHLNVHRLAELRPATVHDLIARCDAFRQPQRIAQLALVCEIDKRGRAGLSESDYPEGRRLLALFEAARSVSARELQAARPDLEGPALGEALRRERVRAIASAMQIA